MSRELCLTVDLGTGGPKIGLVTLSGQIEATELHQVPTSRDGNGAATQDASEWWRIVIEAAMRLLADNDRASRLRAIAVTGQWATTVPVDEHGEPIAPAVLWSDTRGGAITRARVGGPIEGYRPTALWRFVRRSGGAPDLAGADPIGHILHLREREAQTCEQARWLLEPVDYLTMRFSGVASASHASMQASWLLDTRQLNRMEYDPVLCRTIGIDPSKLAPLRPIGSIVGTIDPSVATTLGVSPDVVVITGLPDLHAAALGAGATRRGEAHLALSTTSWISAPVAKKKTDVFHQQATVPGLDNASYLIANSQDTGAKCLDWLRHTTNFAAQTPPDYEALCEMASSSPPGANGVLFTPWLDGERSPVGDHGARASFRGLSLTTTPNDLVRAVLEGVALNSRWLFGHVESFAGQRLESVRLVGGGAQSKLWCQIYADVLNREIVQVADPMYAQLRGMAMMAGVALGHHRLDEIGTLVPEGRRFEPDASSATLYDSLAPLPEKAYRSDRPLLKVLRSARS